MSQSQAPLAISQEGKGIENQKDCLACRVTGAATFSGIGAYAIYQAQQQGALARVRPPGGPRVAGQVQMALGVVFIGLGLGRLII